MKLYDFVLSHERRSKMEGLLGSSRGPEYFIDETKSNFSASLCDLLAAASLLNNIYNYLPFMFTFLMKILSF